jgi:LEA14-like dessication related protein
MLRSTSQCLLIITLLISSACATLSPSFEDPVVTVSSFRVIPSDSISPKFEIGLHIVNPNNVALELEGVAYTASIEGSKVLAGASNTLPVIPAYGEGDVLLNASADLFGSFRVLTNLMNKKTKGLNYQLDLKLDVGTFMPAIRIEKEGLIDLGRKSQ